MIEFSVIIPTYQRPGDLARCLDQLAPGAQTLDFAKYEVIVTDDEGEGSRTEQLVKEHYSWARWIPAQGRGPAANRNNGARNAQGDWLVFTDDDCIPDKGWLRAYQREIKSGCEFPDVLEGQTRPDRPRTNPTEDAPINMSGGELWSCNLAIARKCFNKLGGFDTDYSFSLEDIDFKTRILKSDTKVKYLPEAIVVHPWRKSGFRQLLSRHMKELRGWSTYLEKHPEATKQFSMGHILTPIKPFIKNVELCHNAKDLLLSLEILFLSLNKSLFIQFYRLVHSKSPRTL